MCLRFGIIKGMITPSFFIREIPIYGDLILSPMAGFSDKPFRAICRELGSAMSYTEFVSADGLSHNNHRSWKYFEFAEQERPIACQVFDHDIDRVGVQLIDDALALRHQTIDIMIEELKRDWALSFVVPEVFP